MLAIQPNEEKHVANEKSVNSQLLARVYLDFIKWDVFTNAAWALKSNFVWFSRVETAQALVYFQFDVRITT
jgi:hypothetical protein